METVTIYRVENEKGEGMYQAGTSLIGGNKWVNIIDDNERHPAPWQDDKINPVFSTYRNELKFGFNSLDQLVFWIFRKTWRERLHEEGFFISEIEAEGVHGDTQAIFLPKTRKDIAKISLLSV